MTIIYGRSAWGALPPNHTVPYANQVDTFVVHHTAGVQPSSLEESITLMQATQRQHLAALTPSGIPMYSDIAYNVVAGWNCALIGRGQNVLDGATDTDPSTLTWSCCVLGDYTKDILTPEIRAGLITALQIGVDVWGGRPIAPHRDFYATACPGENLVGQLASITEELYGGDDMDDVSIEKLAAAIVAKLFAHPMTVTDGEPPQPYPTTFEGVQIFYHRELKLIRRAVTK